jgi:transketolase
MPYHREALILELEEHARRLRVDVLDMVHRAQSGHPGGSLSAADILAALYFHHLNIDPLQPNWAERDRFILSKGHAAPALYAALARRGYFEAAELATLRQIDSRLQGHPDRLKTPGVDMNAGALGHGLPVGVGLALAAKMAGQSWRTYVLLGDGETQAGVIWEGALFANKLHLDNLTAILDLNDVQLDGRCHDIMPMEPVVDKWRAFGWAVLETDGHNMARVCDALDEAQHIHDRPTIIVAHTVKGKGVSYMEGQSKWHGRPPTDQEYATALQELGEGARND